MVADSILDSVKKTLNIDADDTAFDVDILMHTNSVLAILNQIGLTDNGFQIDDASTTWDDLLGGRPDLNFVKTYIFTKVRLVFDPPNTSFGIDALKDVATELEVRIHTLLEAEKWA